MRNVRASRRFDHPTGKSVFPEAAEQLVQTSIREKPLDSPGLGPQLLGAPVCHFTCDLESLGSLTHKNQIVPAFEDRPDIDIMMPATGDRSARKPLETGKRSIFSFLHSHGNCEVIETIPQARSFQCRP